MSPAARAAAAAAVGTALTTAAVLVDVRARPSAELALLAAGSGGPAWDVIRADFPDAAQRAAAGLGHDGQLFYAIARRPLPPEAAARSLDHPRYRLQRPLLAWLAWALHPGGGGRGLVWALFAVGVAGLFAGGLASGVLADALGGRPEAGALFPLLGGSFASLRITTSDALASALALASLALLVRRRAVAATVAGVLAVLAKETALLVLVGAAAWRRSRVAVLVATIAAVAAAGWWVWLGHAVGGDTAPPGLLAPPLRGLAEAARVWAGGEQRLAALWVPAGLVLGALAIALRGVRHPCAPPILLQLPLLAVLSVDVLGLDFNGPRATLPLTALAVVALVTPAGSRAGASGRE